MSPHLLFSKFLSSLAIETLTKVTKKVKSVQTDTIIAEPATVSTNTGHGEFNAIQTNHPASTIDNQNTERSVRHVS